jgi:hypothetical protein
MCLEKTNLKRLGLGSRYHASTYTVYFRGENIVSKAYFFIILKRETWFPHI